MFVIDSLNYFSFFKYCPTVEEYWRFYPKFLGLKDLEKVFQKRGLQIKKGRVVGQRNKGFLAETLERAKISEAKLAKRLGLIKFLRRLPGVKFIGVSGTVSVLNANKEDDIDTAPPHTATTLSRPHDSAPRGA